MRRISNDSGVKVTVGLKGRRVLGQSQKAGLKKVAEVADAGKSAIVMMLLPDENIGDVYNQGSASQHQEGRRAGFRAWFQCPLRRCESARDLDVIMIAPKGPGHLVRSTYVAGGGCPALWPSGATTPAKRKDLALAYAKTNGGSRGGVIETNFREELKPICFGEQTVLCGGIVELIKAGYETLVEAGYAPEMAYFECPHETKLIVDLIYEGGIANMNYSISNNAEYGEYVTGPEGHRPGSESRDKQALHDIQTGEYAKSFILENKAGAPRLPRSAACLPSTRSSGWGEVAVDDAPGSKQNKLVDKARN